jgi:hypothetical protein
VIVGFLQLAGSLTHQFLKTAGGIFSFSQVLGGLVLSPASTQRRLCGADQRHRLDRPLLQCYVPKLRDQPQHLLTAPHIVMMRCQDDEWEVGPGRLLLHPVEKASRIGPKKGFLGDHGRTSTCSQLAAQCVDIRAELRRKASLTEKGAGSGAVPARRRKHQYPFATASIDRVARQSGGLSEGRSGVAPPR